MSSSPEWLPVDSQDDQQDAQLDDVLQVVFANWRHGYVTDMRTICALLQTSSACRRAVQHATAHCHAALAVTDLDKLSQFCTWLPQHAGLITELTLQGWCMERADLAANWPAAQQHISTAVQQSLQASQNGRVVSADSRSSSLRICWCSTPCPTSPALVEALAAVSSLTYLSLVCAPSQPSAAVCAGLGHLRTIQELNIIAPSSAEGIPGMVTAELAMALQQLQQLTSLWLEPYVHPESLQHFPSSVQKLDSTLAVEPDAQFEPAHELSGEPVCIDLHHLTQLTSLSLNTSVPLSGDSVLPKELITLTAHGPCNFHPGSKLEILLVTDQQQSLGLMQQLPSMPQLRYLTVEMNEYYGEASEAEIVAVVAAVQHATQVTGLEWVFTGLDLSAEDYAVLATDVGIGNVLASLTQLQRLFVWLPGIPEAEVLKLTSLTSLTRLDLSYCDEGVTDMAVVALACKLKKLQNLDLAGCSSLSQAVLPALGSLTAMSRLVFCCGPGLTDEGLLQLTTLTALQELWIEGSSALSAVSDDGKARFVAAMPQLDTHNISD